MTKKHNAIITIGRQFGSGGRHLGKALAEAFGFDFYDRRLLDEAASHAGICTHFFEKSDEQAPSFFSSLFSYNMDYAGYGVSNTTSRLSNEELYRAQADTIRAIADRGPAVIVGRCADYALRGRNDVVNLFLHAPIEKRIDRIVERLDATDREQARQLALKADKARASYYNFYTDKQWGQAQSYDLSLDSSLLTDGQIIDIVDNYLTSRKL